MNYCIENEFLKVVISDKGAEMQSIVGKKTGTEYLWQGNEKYWAGRAPIMFPICGRLFDGKYTYEGKEYEMILHGFARFQTFEVIAKSDEAITFELRDNEETRACYPFSFLFRVTFSLDGNNLKNTFYVENENEKDLPFSVGGHPGFNVPFKEGESFDDYYLEFACVKPTSRIHTSDNGFFYAGYDDAYPMENGKIIRLSHELLNNHGMFFTNMCNRVSLKSTKNDKALTMHFEDMTHLGLWHKPESDAPYVCIEPWHGIPATDGKVDDLATKNEMIHLAKGESFSNYLDITIDE